jgi:MoaA/NifB/PqqE/SkfB family radical SAM enzyme
MTGFEPTDGLVQYLILFVTGRCNARCATCFYWREMQQEPVELSLEEIERIARPLGPVPTLLLSGGEPTLRADLPEIVATFHRHNAVQYVGLPTNGLLTDRAVEFAERILAGCPDLRLDVNVSLDAVGEHHDAIRGVPGNFDRALDTIRRLCETRDSTDRLFVNVETVLTARNWRHIRKLLEYVRTRLDVNGHYVELLRGDPRDGGLDLPPLGVIHRVHQLVMKNHVLYHANPRKRRWPPELPYLRELYRWQEEYLRHGKWPARHRRRPTCPAADAIAVIEPDGRVRGCELRGVIGDLRQSGYDLRRVLESEAAQSERQAIRAARCACTHCVFIYRTFAAHELPSQRNRRWLGHWFALRGRVAQALR